jgi:hypothetical protein
VPIPEKVKGNRPAKIARGVIARLTKIIKKNSSFYSKDRIR